MPNDDEVLVRVHAAGLDRGVWHVMAGLPYLIRLVVPTLGLRKPKAPVRGMDLAGRVETVGKDVTRFRPGDAVFGWTDTGSYARYVSAPVDHFQPKPADLTFEQAAAVPISAFAALQALRDEGEVQPGQKVLVIGAAGGVGSFATAGHRSLTRLRRALTSRGTLVIVGSEGRGRWMGGFDRQLRALVLSRFVSQRLRMLGSKPRQDDLQVLRERIEAGKLIPAVDRTFPLREVPEAIRYLVEGHGRGKVVITALG